MAKLTYLRIANTISDIGVAVYDLEGPKLKSLGDASVSDGHLEDLRKQAGKLRRLVNDLEQLVEGADDVGGDVAEFAEFFETVASGVVQAQRTLDRETADYLEDIRGKGYLLPTTFRIPKVSAEIKFGFKSVSGSRLNLIFYGDSSEQTSRNEQSMSFDIVAAPLTPEARDELAGGGAGPAVGGPRSYEGMLESLGAEEAVAVQPAAPSVTFVLAPVRRRRLMQAVDMWSVAAEAAGDREAHVVRTALLAQPDRVLIADAGDDRYYLIVANPPNIKNIGVWVLTVNDEPTLMPAYRYTTKPERAEEEALELIHPALVAMCDRQEAFLAS